MEIVPLLWFLVKVQPKTWEKRWKTADSFFWVYMADCENPTVWPDFSKSFWRLWLAKNQGEPSQISLRLQVLHGHVPAYERVAVDALTSELDLSHRLEEFNNDASLPAGMVGTGNIHIQPKERRDGDSVCFSCLMRCCKHLFLMVWGG